MKQDIFKLIERYVETINESEKIYDLIHDQILNAAKFTLKDFYLKHLDLFLEKYKEYISRDVDYYNRFEMPLFNRSGSNLFVDSFFYDYNNDFFKQDQIYQVILDFNDFYDHYYNDIDKSIMLMRIQKLYEKYPDAFPPSFSNLEVFE